MSGDKGHTPVTLAAAILLFPILLWLASAFAIFRFFPAKDFELALGCGSIGIRWGWINLWRFAPHRWDPREVAACERVPAALSWRCRTGLMSPSVWGIRERLGVVSIPFWMVMPATMFLFFRFRRSQDIGNAAGALRSPRRKAAKWIGLLFTLVLAGAWATACTGST